MTHEERQSLALEFQRFVDLEIRAGEAACEAKHGTTHHSPTLRQAMRATISAILEGYFDDCVDRDDSLRRSFDYWAGYVDGARNS